MLRETTFGFEFEAYTLSIPDWRICRELLYPRRGTVERGERFTRDVTIGIEYNSKVFRTVREALFLLKTGLRKYIRKHFEKPGRAHYSQSVFLTGGWRDRSAGVHLHIGRHPRPVRYGEAAVAARRIHDHIPFLVALTANSPVWSEQIRRNDSNRLLRRSRLYFKVSRRGRLDRQRYAEMTFNPPHSRKPPTLELRFMDSTLPEFACAALAVVQVLLRRRETSRISHERYLAARESAARRGPEARLFWNHRPVRARDYVDLLFRRYRAEFDALDLPDDVLDVFRLLKRGWNAARILRRACRSLQSRYPRTWQRHLARRYATAIQGLLDGGNLFEFAEHLGVRLPDVRRVWLGEPPGGPPSRPKRRPKKRRRPKRRRAKPRVKRRAKRRRPKRRPKRRPASRRRVRRRSRPGRRRISIRLRRKRALARRRRQQRLRRLRAARRRQAARRRTRRGLRRKARRGRRRGTRRRTVRRKRGGRSSRRRGRRRRARRRR